MTDLHRADERFGRFSGADELIGVISSLNLSRAGETGYALVFTRSRVIGARRAESDPDIRAYLGPGSTASDEDRRRANALAERLLPQKQFVVGRDTIGQVLYSAPGFIDGGRVIFKTNLESFRIDIPPVSGWNAWPEDAASVISQCLMAFAPERLYDGRSGALLIAQRLRSRK